MSAEPHLETFFPMPNFTFADKGSLVFKLNQNIRFIKLTESFSRCRFVVWFHYPPTYFPSLKCFPPCRKRLYTIPNRTKKRCNYNRKIFEPTKELKILPPVFFSETRGKKHIFSFSAARKRGKSNGGERFVYRKVLAHSDV